MPHGIMDFGMLSIPLLIALIIFSPYVYSMQFLEEIIQSLDKFTTFSFSLNVYISSIFMGLVLGLAIASVKNRSMLFWGVLCCVFPPLVLLLICLPRVKIASPQALCSHCGKNTDNECACECVCEQSNTDEA